jgi:hypothetical protein
MEANHKTYRFFKNLYDYDEQEVLLIGKSKIDKATQQCLNGHQKIFRKSDNTYFYRCNEKLIGQCAKPVLIKKNYRLSNPLDANSLLTLSQKSEKKPVINLQKTPLKKQLFKQDFQQFLITNLLLMSHKAEFLKIPLEADEVPKLKSACNNFATAHFQTNTVFYFIFKPDQALLIRNFMDKLDLRLRL